MMKDINKMINIKPRVKNLDSRDKVKDGWIEKHFKGRKMPKRAK